MWFKTIRGIHKLNRSKSVKRNVNSQTIVTQRMPSILNEIVRCWYTQRRSNGFSYTFAFERQKKHKSTRIPLKLIDATGILTNTELICWRADIIFYSITNSHEYVQWNKLNAGQYPFHQMLTNALQKKEKIFALKSISMCVIVRPEITILVNCMFY